MPDKIEIRVKKSHITQPEKDITAIAHLPLVNGLVAAPVETWQMFARSFGVVRPEAIEIDEEGRVLIRDATFAASVKAILDKLELEGEGEADSNNGCANVLAKCAEIEEVLQ